MDEGMAVKQGGKKGQSLGVQEENKYEEGEANVSGAT